MATTGKGSKVKITIDVNENSLGNMNLSETNYRVDFYAKEKKDSAVTGFDTHQIVHIQCAEDGQSGSAACFVYPFSTTPHDSVFYFNDTYYGADVHYTHLKLMSSYINGRWLWAVINMDNCHAMNFDFN